MTNAPDVALEQCQECQAHISWIDAAYSCDLACTFCADCAEQFGHVCPNCSGQLSVRPRQTQAIGNAKRA